MASKTVGCEPEGWLTQEDAMVISDGYSDSSVLTNFHGNCVDLLKSMPDNQISLTFTSPRFDIKKSYESSKQDLDKWKSEQKEIIELIIQKTKPGGSLVWDVAVWVSGSGSSSIVIPLDAFIIDIFLELGLQIRNRIIWEYPHGPEAKVRFSGRHNTAIWAVKPGGEYSFDLDPIRVPQKYPGKRYSRGPKKGQLSGNPLGKNPGDVWRFSNVKASHPEKIVGADGKPVHPCQFPIEYPERFVLSTTKPDDLVFDPFSGLGATACAALKHGRRAACSDLDETYVTTAMERFVKLSKGEMPYADMKRPSFDSTTDKRSQTPSEWQ